MHEYIKRCPRVWLSAQWVTEWLSFDTDIKSALGHQDQTDIIGMINIGTAVEPPQPRTRPHLDEIVSEFVQFQPRSNI